MISSINTDIISRYISQLKKAIKEQTNLVLDTCDSEIRGIIDEAASQLDGLDLPTSKLDPIAEKVVEYVNRFVKKTVEQYLDLISEKVEVIVIDAITKVGEAQTSVI